MEPWRQRAAKALPPAFVLGLVALIESVYVCLHLWPLLHGEGRPPADRFSVEHLEHLERRALGQWRAAMSQFLLFMLLVCYARAVLTNPGAVPQTEEWLSEQPNVVTRELKLSGKRRSCKWCCQYKPDRAHHCRACKKCVLRMDHHCPWIANCVGFGNHKYFLLVVFYTVLDLAFIACTLGPAVVRAADEEMSETHRFLLVLATTLTAIMLLLMSVFLAFHVYLASLGMTTIEFCEKTTMQGLTLRRYGTSYDYGPYRNAINVLGPNPLFWILPICPPEGGGAKWPLAVGAELLRESADPEWTTSVRTEPRSSRASSSSSRDGR